MAKRKSSMIGHDPLAWLLSEEPATENTDTKQSNKTMSKNKTSSKAKAAKPTKSAAKKVTKKAVAKSAKPAAKKPKQKPMAKKPAAKKSKAETKAAIVDPMDMLAPVVADESRVASNDAGNDVGQETVLQLKDIQDVSSLAELFTQWKDQQWGAKFIIDAGEVTRIDAASLQCVYAFILEAKTHDTEIEWRNPSDAVCEAASLLGMKEGLHLSACA